MMADAARLRAATGRRTLLFVDEIHRFNRAQQDAFLPYVERGDIVLVGATTENPSFELNAALLSRCRVVVLEPLAGASSWRCSARAGRRRSAGSASAGVAARATRRSRAIAQLADGDAPPGAQPARAARSTDARLDGGAELAGPSTTSAQLRAAQGPALRQERRGALQPHLGAPQVAARERSGRGALLAGAHARGGRGPALRGAAAGALRREDVGLADPQALDRRRSPAGRPTSGWARPRASWRSPRSRSISRSRRRATRSTGPGASVAATIAERPAEPVPLAIRNAPTALMKGLGYGRGYVYAPDTGRGVARPRLPARDPAGTRFYDPSGKGVEERLGERLDEFARRRAAARSATGRRVAGREVGRRICRLPPLRPTYFSRRDCSSRATRREIRIAR